MHARRHNGSLPLPSFGECQPTELLSSSLPLPSAMAPPEVNRYEELKSLDSLGTYEIVNSVSLRRDLGIVLRSGEQTRRSIGSTRNSPQADLNEAAAAADAYACPRAAIPKFSYGMATAG